MSMWSWRGVSVSAVTLTRLRCLLQVQALAMGARRWAHEQPRGDIGMHTIHRLLTWPAALFIAGILLWYEQYKLTGNPGSVMLFTTLSDWLWIDGYEKPFRLAVGSAEIVASVLVVVPYTRMYGAALALAIMSGAIFFHLASPLGIDPYNDGGSLFKEACEVWLCAAFILLSYRQAVLETIRLITGQILPPSTAR
jgi:uncharacterized membrane protein YphA (DoxX/SURF4 family)